MVKVSGAALGRGLAILLLPVVGYLIYAPGLATGFFFDDYPNLVGLDTVSDLNSALGFILEPKGGPLGRPLSMLSFLLNAPSWLATPEDFLHVNICIHLINAMLLLWSCLLGGRLVGMQGQRATLFAIAVAALWLVQPLLVSANLMIIQRMTTLSATFSLLGIGVFLYGQSLARENMRRALVWMSLGVGVGTVLSILAKENGALLPLLIWVIESTLLLAHVSRIQTAAYRYWRIVFLAVPSIVVIGYLLHFLPGVAGAYVNRDFSLEQRVLTEPRIVLQYLWLLVFPRRTLIAPFQDDFPLSNGLLDPPVTIVALGVVTGLLLGAALLRRRYPIFSFAVLFFFAGHLVESTFIPLELYFEHRNYLPSIGVVLALASVPFAFGQQLRLSLGLFSVYWALFAWVCFTVVQVFGSHEEAALLWAGEHPDSIRANQYLALVLMQHGQFERAQKIIANYSDRHSDDLGVGLQSLQLACSVNAAKERLQILKERPGFFGEGKLNPLICSSMEKMANLQIAGECPGLDVEDLREIAQEVLANRHIQSGREVSYCLNDVMAMVEFNERDFSATMQYLMKAFQYRKYWQVAERLVEVPLTAGRYDLARESLELVRANLPSNSFQRKIWQERVDKLELVVRREELKSKQ